jgi:hypothetical protein
MEDEVVVHREVVERKPKATASGSVVMVLGVAAVLIAMVATMYNFAPDPNDAIQQRPVITPSDISPVPVKPVTTVPVTPLPSKN